jgi:hypothetical protein
VNGNLPYTSVSIVDFANSGVSAVAHDSTLTGDGTAGSPLGVASPLLVRDLDNPARQPINAGTECNLLEGCTAFIFTVPSGKRLVIEYVSIDADMPVGQVTLFSIETTAGGKQLIHRLPQTPPAVKFGGEGRANMGQQVRLYADPGTRVVVNGIRNELVGGWVYNFTLSGYLVDAP